MSEDALAIILILIPTFIIFSLISTQIIRMKRLKPLRPLFTILLGPGTVVHEASHYLMSRMLGVHLLRLRPIETDGGWNSAGNVIRDPFKNSFFKPFVFAIAPSLINAISACLLILIAPYFTEQWVRILVSWLVASLILQCAPSQSDLALALRSLRKYPKSCLKEFGCLAIGLLAGLVLYGGASLGIGVELPLLLIAVFSLFTTALVYIFLKQG